MSKHMPPMRMPRAPEPPPMRIGDRGDTIGWDGVRRKANGSLRKFEMDALRWVRLIGFILSMILLSAKLFGVI